MLSLVLLCLIACLCTNAANGEPADSIKTQRKLAANRQRRIILNNDGNEPVTKLTEPSAQAFLDLRTSALADSQVDSIFYCTNYSGFGVFTHFTRIGQLFTTQEGRFGNNRLEAMRAASLDPLRLIVDFGKKNQKEIFWSVRMNDTHDGSGADYGPVMFRANEFKNKHPEYLLGTAKRRPKHGAWTAVDYGRAEIRDLAFRYCEEVCQNYDIDGIELDFFRHPVFFRSTSNGIPATNEDLAAMTSLVGRIRKMADAEGLKRGRPILIAVRTPDSVEYARAIGLDIEKWMADDLLDLFIPSGTFQLNDWGYSIALAHKYGTKVYPSLDETRARDEANKKLRMTNLAYRARAADVWASGADGVYLFNFPDYWSPTSELLRELGDPQELTALDKDYFGSVRGIGNSAGGNFPVEPFLKLEILNPEKPRAVPPGKAVTARLTVGEDFSQTKPATLQLRLRFDPPPEPQTISVTINDRPLTLKQASGDWLEFSISAKDAVLGSNPVSVTLSADQKVPLNWTDLLLEVRHSK